MKSINAELLAKIKNPEIRKLCLALQDMPAVMARWEREKEEQSAFARKVFEKAVMMAGKLGQPLPPRTKRDE